MPAERGVVARSQILLLEPAKQVKADQVRLSNREDELDR